MTSGKINLDALLRRLSDRSARRTEANVQSDLHAFLLAAPLDLEDKDIEIVLEQQAGEGKRIDVEAGLCVFEVKRDLRRGHVQKNAETQLAGYVASRTRTMNQHYVGVLTDGSEWHLYHLTNDQLHEVSCFRVESNRPDVDGLSVWLEGVLATKENLNPTPQEIERMLGANSPAHALARAELLMLYRRAKDVPEVRIRRELWARLLTTAYGTGFSNSDDVFVEHSLLVLIAEIIAHAVIGLDPTAPDVTAQQIVSGQLFSSRTVYGVVEADFFDWVVEVDEGLSFVKDLARRISRFSWRRVEHDVLKALYESMIPQAQRKQLGEYYTPGWLAEQVVASVVRDPLNQRVLDPACGSGTFLFQAIRRYISAAESAGRDNASTLQELVNRVLGMDIHPVAVTFARVTYLMAIGAERLEHEDRPSLSIPVYLGDSIQWGGERTVFSSDALVIPTVGDQVRETELRFPQRTLADAGRFDQLVAEMATRASVRRARGAPIPKLASLFKKYAVHVDEQDILTETFETLCRLHDMEQNHIWGYYVRNLARPVWMTRDPNKADVLVGNPPWLSLRFMTNEMKREFRRLSKERGLWAGASVATHQDLAGLFVLRSVERYLRAGGRFGFVMPWSVLRGRQYAGFRSGKYPVIQQAKDLKVAFSTPWDFHAVKPAFFSVPCCVVFGRRSSRVSPLPDKVDEWSGNLPDPNVTWAVAAEYLKKGKKVVDTAAPSCEGGSPYASRFAQGASLVPRLLVIVEPVAAGPLGASRGRMTVASRRTRREKQPWKSLPALKGNVEKQFVRLVHLGETVLPYRTMQPLKCIVPWDGQRFLQVDDEYLSSYPGLEDWLRQAERLWNKYRVSDRLTLIDQLNYRRKLADQAVVRNPRVVYGKSGMYGAAAIVIDDSIVDHKLYWGAVASMGEARYLEAIINSDFVTRAVRPLQARGEHNPRDYDKYVWKLSIPLYDPREPQHSRLVDLAEEAERLVAKLDLSAGKRFESLRRQVREAIAASRTGKQIERIVAALL